MSFHPPKINKRGVGIRAGGSENFQKLISRGDDYSVLKSIFYGKTVHAEVKEELRLTLNS